VITILMIDREAGGSPAAEDPAIEVLRVSGAEQAIEKLGRNRRIDAVLLLCGPDNAAVLASILEEESAPPPFYAPADPPPPAGVRRLAAGSLDGLLAGIAADLSS
jgi:hypothetical protein